MSNSVSKKQCSLKRLMRAEQEKLGPLSYVGMCSDSHYADFNRASDEFYRGPMRHGNNRHGIAKEKVIDRRIDRKRNNRELLKQIKDEE